MEHRILLSSFAHRIFLFLLIPITFSTLSKGSVSCLGKKQYQKFTLSFLFTWFSSFMKMEFEAELFRGSLIL